MVAMRHQWANITPVEAHDREIAMPTHRIQRIKREGDGADLPVTFHLHLRLLLRILFAELVIDRRHVQHGRVKDRVIAD